VHKTVLILVLIRLFACAQEARAQTNASNLETLQRLFAIIALRADSIIDKTGATVVYLEHRSLEAQSPERMLYTSLVEAFARKSRLVYARSDTGLKKNEGIAAQFKIIAFELRYRKLPKPGWFRRSPLRREARVAVDFDVRDMQSSRSHFQGALEEKHDDTLKVSVEKLETPSLPFTAGVWQANENRRSWLEPALLTAATGAIIYAFYSLRSQ